MKATKQTTKEIPIFESIKNVILIYRCGDNSNSLYVCGGRYPGWYHDNLKKR